MIRLKDNSSKELSLQSQELSMVRCLAGHSLKQLLKEHGDTLLIWPHSFAESRNGEGDTSLFTLTERTDTAVIQTGNLMGFIGYQATELAITSRFTSTEQDYFLHYMLLRAFNLHVFNLDHGLCRDEAFDFLIYLFPKVLLQALSQGLYKEYQKRSYNDARVRGVIDIGRHLKLNSPPNGRIAYHTREYSYDNTVTQLIRHTIEYLGRTELGRSILSSSDEMRTAVSRIIENTPRYDAKERNQVVRRNLRPLSHPYYQAYRGLQKLCVQILRHDKLMYHSSTEQVHGILFDGAVLWEEYLGTLLTPKGFEHPNNRTGQGRIHLSQTSKFPRYPDFYHRSGSVVIDAKYKRTTSRNDIHQVIAYMYRLQAQKGVFIMPEAQAEDTPQNSDEEMAHNEIYKLAGYGGTLTLYRLSIARQPQDTKDFATLMAGYERTLLQELGI